MVKNMFENKLPDHLKMRKAKHNDQG